MTQEDWEYLAHKMFGSGDFWPHYLSSKDKWVRFGMIWEWATKQEWWGTFLFFSRVNMDDILESEGAEPVSHSCMGLVHPDRFPQLVVDFLREKGEYDGLCI